MASTKVEALECLLDTYAEISESMPYFKSYDSLFDAHPDVLHVLERCYEDILSFHHAALKVFQKPGTSFIAPGVEDVQAEIRDLAETCLGWRRMFDSVWKTFRTKFKPILDSFTRHRELLDHVKTTAVFSEIQLTRTRLLESINQSSEEMKSALENLQNHKTQMMERLGYRADEVNRPHKRVPSEPDQATGRWIFHNEIFKKWLDFNVENIRILYLNGLPGAGKLNLFLQRGVLLLFIFSSNF